MNAAFSMDSQGFEQALTMVRTTLKEKKVHHPDYSHAVLASEEILGDLKAHAEPNEQIHISLQSFFGSTTITFSARGEEYAFAEEMVPDARTLFSQDDRTVEGTIRNYILNSYTKGLKYRHRGGKNTVKLTVERLSLVAITLFTILAAVVTGIALACLLSQEQLLAINKNLLDPAKKMYLNTLRIIAGPVVFFSIASCIAQYGKPSELGRIGAKIISFYIFTTAIAVTIGIVISLLFSPGDPALVQSVSKAPDLASKHLSLSAVDFITGIIPSDIVSPLLQSNMIQLLFLALLFGFAAVALGEKSKPIISSFSSLNELFMQVTATVLSTTPVIVFCSILSLELQLGLSSLISLLGIIGTFLCGLGGMMVIYFLILIGAGINPVTFIKKYGSTMLQVFSLNSSNAAISVNMSVCKEKLGISPKIYSFSIPLGATINMDGTSILLAVQTIALAQVYGIQLTAGMLVSLAVYIVVLSIGAPGVPGAGILMMSMLLLNLGIPVDAVSLVVGIAPLVGMFISMSNCLGDVVVSLAVAKSEGLVDLKSW